MLLLYRSQDKGFHVEKALVHVFTRSLPYTSAQILQLEEAVEGEKVQYHIPVELSDYIFRYSNSETPAVSVIIMVRLLSALFHQGISWLRFCPPCKVGARFSSQRTAGKVVSVHDDKDRSLPPHG